MELLGSIFLGAFFFGLLLCVATLLLGSGHHDLHDLGLHLDGGHDPSAVAGGHDGGVSPLNLTALTAFVAWFGGIGYLALTNWQLAIGVSLALAVGAGLFGWGVVYLFLNRVLARGEGVMRPEDYRLEGTVARVTGPIRGGRIGEIQFTQAGARRSEGARSLDGADIERETEVVIVRYERGLAYVQPWEQFVGDEVAPSER